MTHKNARLRASALACMLFLLFSPHSEASWLSDLTGIEIGSSEQRAEAEIKTDARADARATVCKTQAGNARLSVPVRRGLPCTVTTSNGPISGITD
jgi:hypothetical protein